MKLTDEQLREPDVTIYIPDGLEVPYWVGKTLEHYTGASVNEAKTGKPFTKYTLPAYLVRQWLEEYKNQLVPLTKDFSNGN